MPPTALEHDDPSLVVDFDEGHQARLRSPYLLTNGQRRPILVALEAVAPPPLPAAVRYDLDRAVLQKNTARQAEILAGLKTETDLAAELRIADVMIVTLLDSWTFDLPHPALRPTVEANGILIGSPVLEELRADDYDRLRATMRNLRHVFERRPWQPHSRPTKSATLSPTRCGPASSKGRCPKSGASTKRSAPASPHQSRTTSNSPTRPICSASSRGSCMKKPNVLHGGRDSGRRP